MQEKVDGELFLALASHIDKHGWEGCFYEMKQIYFDLSRDKSKDQIKSLKEKIIKFVKDVRKAK